jgi:superfamily II DNA or RNA helicase
VFASRRLISTIRSPAFSWITTSRAFDPAANITIVSYDKLVGPGGKAMHAALMEQSYDVLICDEAHFFAQ